MLASSVPVNFSIPFANAAGGAYLRTIPVASQIGITAGAASLTDGFPPLCFSPQISGGIPPSGADFNGLLKQITQNIQWWGSGGYPQYNAGFSTAIGGYPNGAILQSANLAGYWISTVDNNTSNPDANGANWLPKGFSGVTPVTMTTANVTLTLAQYANPIIVVSGALTGSWNLILPNIVGQWLIINNTTGPYTVTAKTVAGTGTPIDKTIAAMVACDATNVTLVTGNFNLAIPQNIQAAAYTTVITDANKHILHPIADNVARTYTIDSNVNVPYPIGTTLTFVNEINTVTIAIAGTDTLMWSPSGATGSRTLSVNGMATAVKITATKWMISGPGLA